MNELDAIRIIRRACTEARTHAAHALSASDGGLPPHAARSLMKAAQALDTAHQTLAVWDIGDVTDDELAIAAQAVAVAAHAFAQATATELHPCR